MEIMRGPLTWALNGVRMIGYEVFGYELVVEANDHSFDVWMQKPQADDDGGRAWDDDLYYRGQMYYMEHCNPIKPVLDQEGAGFEEQSTIDHDEGEVQDRHDERDDRGRPISMVASWEWKKYLDQHLASELVLPDKQWKYILILCGVIGAFVLMNLAITAYIAGSL